MKRTRLLAILAIAVVAGLLVTGCKDPMGLNTTPNAGIASHTAYPPVSYAIWAGQHDSAGYAKVWFDGTNLYIKYQMTGNWWLEETHAHVALTLDGIPQKNGNPIPGKFEFKNSFSPRVQTWMYTIPARDGWVEGTCLHIATHCVVSQLVDGEYVNQQTGWAGPHEFPGSNWALYLKYCLKNPYKDVNLPPGDDLPKDSVSMKIKRTLFSGSAYPSDDVAAFQVTLWNVLGSTPLPHLYDVWDDDNWRGWCLELKTPIYETAAEYRVKLYSNQDPNLPIDLQSPVYDNLNYLINHKIPGCTAIDVQTAIWYLMGDLINFGTLSPNAQQMVTEANLYGDGWHPGTGEWVGVLAHGKLTPPQQDKDAQLVMIEVDP